MRPKTRLLLLLPAVVAFAGLLVLPLFYILDQSFRTYIPGRVGASIQAPYTLANFRDLLFPAYFHYFVDTFKLSLVACLIALIISYPIAVFVARHPSKSIRRLIIGLFISLLFLSLLVRVYSLQLTFGPVGLQRSISLLLGIQP